MAWILYDFVASHHSFNPSVAFETSISNVAIEDIPAISVLDATPSLLHKSQKALRMRVQV